MQEILEILQRNAKADIKQIAAMVGKPEVEVEAEIKELEQSGIIRKYKAVINWSKAGDERVFAIIEVKVSPQRNIGFDAIAKRIYNFPEVHSVYLVSGAFDLAVVVEGKNMREIAYFVAEKLAPLPHVLSTATHFVLKTYKLDGEILEEEEVDRREAVTL